MIEDLKLPKNQSYIFYAFRSMTSPNNAIVLQRNYFHEVLFMTLLKRVSRGAYGRSPPTAKLYELE